ncbi:MAG: coenzyme F420-0:L-glutamate ligase [Patescibacteria group bacterium]
MEAERKTFKPNPGKNLEIAVGNDVYFRFPIKTPLITEKDDLMELLEKHAVPFFAPGDLIFVSEKVVALTQGRIIPIVDIRPSWLARLLARKVKNNYGTPQFRGFGHGTPMGMQLLIEEAGYPRVFLAAAVSAATRPLGVKGLFYTIVGKLAKSVDCPMSFTMQPYNRYAKLAPRDPDGVARKIKEKFGHETAIVDANYQGVFSLGKSDRKISEKFIYDVLRDNPLGQSDEMTPFCIIRKKIS